MRAAVVAAILALLIVASFGAGYLAGNGSTRTETITSTMTSVMTSTKIAPVFLPNAQVIGLDSSSGTGIDLIVGLNATIVKQGQDLPNVIEVVNTQPRENNVSVGTDFPVKPFSGKCIPGDYTPIDVEMYSGYYDRGNISSASPLPYIRTCPAVFSDSLTHYGYYLFQPSSANATLYGLNYAGAPANSGPMSLRLVNDTSLYQFMSSFPQGVHPVLPVGVYTMAVQDFWGEIVILHFSVAS